VLLLYSSQVYYCLHSHLRNVTAQCVTVVKIETLQKLLNSKILLFTSNARLKSKLVNVIGDCHVGGRPAAAVLSALVLVTDDNTIVSLL